MLSHKSLKLSSLGFLVSLSRLQVHWPFLFFHLVCYWSPLMYFSVHELYFSALWLLFGTSSHFLSHFWSSHSVYSFFSHIQLASLWPLPWTLYQAITHLCWRFCFVFRFYLVLWFRKYSVSSFCLTLCVGFYVVDETVPSRSFEGVALCRRRTYTALPQLSVVSQTKQCLVRVNGSQ